MPQMSLDLVSSASLPIVITKAKVYLRTHWDNIDDCLDVLRFRCRSSNESRVCLMEHGVETCNGYTRKDSQCRQQTAAERIISAPFHFLNVGSALGEAPKNGEECRSSKHGLMVFEC